jgi:hypothetical protein
MYQSAIWQNENHKPDSGLPSQKNCFEQLAYQLLVFPAHAHVHVNGCNKFAPAYAQIRVSIEKQSDTETGQQVTEK